MGTCREKLGPGFEDIGMLNVVGHYQGYAAIFAMRSPDAVQLGLNVTPFQFRGAKCIS